MLASDTRAMGRFWCCMVRFKERKKEATGQLGSHWATVQWGWWRLYFKILCPEWILYIDTRNHQDSCSRICIADGLPHHVLFMVRFEVIINYFSPWETRYLCDWVTLLFYGVEKHFLFNMRIFFFFFSFRGQFPPRPFAPFIKCLFRPNNFRLPTIFFHILKDIDRRRGPS